MRRKCVILVLNKNLFGNALISICADSSLCGFSPAEEGKKWRAKCRQRWQETTSEDTGGEKWDWAHISDSDWLGLGMVCFWGVGKGYWEVALRKHPPLMRPTQPEPVCPCMHSHSFLPSSGKHAHSEPELSWPTDWIQEKMSGWTIIHCAPNYSLTYPVIIIHHT